MEARLYAEDPTKGFLPSTGALELFQLPADFGRVDTGVYEGAEVSPFYDPMIAKLIAHGETRDEARETLSEMLEDSAVWPVKTNRSEEHTSELQSLMTISYAVLCLQKQKYTTQT